MKTRKDITGFRSGRLTALRREPNRNGKVRWACRCDCGNEVVLDYGSLKYGGTLSCGCLASELTATRNAKHGHAKRGRVSSTFIIWEGMNQRCEDTSHPWYHRYGGRGITVCERWKEFVNFLEDMGERPHGLSIDRIDNDKGYSKENCRWATRKQQSNNRSSYNNVITWNGESRTLAQWSEFTGIHKTTIWDRLRHGWSIEKALSTEVAHA